MRLASTTLTFSLLTLSVGFSGCAASDAEDTASGDGSEQALTTNPTTAKCQLVNGSKTTFTLSQTGSWRSLSAYRVSDIVINGISKPGTFNTNDSPLGKGLSFKAWNGYPLMYSALVTETRVKTEWRSDRPGITGRIQCVADLGPNPAEYDRFRRAYEFSVTDSFASRRDTGVLNLVARSTPNASLPAVLQKRAREYQRAFSTWQFEGQTLYMMQSTTWGGGPVVDLLQTFYRPDGTIFANLELGANDEVLHEWLTQEERRIVPQRTVTWFRRN